MGQYWCLINLDSRRVILHSKLGEFIWDCHEYLISRLSKWNITNYHRYLWKQCSLWRVLDSSLQRICRGEIIHTVCYVRSMFIQKSIRCTGDQDLSISCLPVELIDMIFMELDEFPDCFCLSLNSHRYTVYYSSGSKTSCPLDEPSMSLQSVGMAVLMRSNQILT